MYSMINHSFHHSSIVNHQSIMNHDYDVISMTSLLASTYQRLEISGQSQSLKVSCNCRLRFFQFILVTGFGHVIVTCVTWLTIIITWLVTSQLRHHFPDIPVEVDPVRPNDRVANFFARTVDFISTWTVLCSDVLQ